MATITSFTAGRLTVTRNQDNITIQSPDHGRRRPLDTSLTVTQSEDQVTIRGHKDREKFNWNIDLSPTGAEVNDPDPRPTRRGSRSNNPSLGSVQLPEGVQLQGEALAKFGLSVASSLVGLPLDILTQ